MGLLLEYRNEIPVDGDNEFFERMDPVLQPATPVPTTVKSRARARLVELHELHGWNKDSPISISKPKSDSKERQREAGAKRMRNMGFYEVAAECGYSTAAALREELEHRVFTEGQDKRDYKKLIEEQKQEQARRDKTFWDEIAELKQRREEQQVMADRNEKAMKDFKFCQEREAKRKAEMEGELRKEMEAELEAEMEVVRMEIRAELQVELGKEYVERARREGEAFQKLVRECVDMEASHLKARIAELEMEAKPQPKPKPQPGTAALHKQIAQLEDENKALAAKLTKVESLKRARQMQRDRRGAFRKLDPNQRTAGQPAAKKQNTKGGSNSTTVNNNS